MHGALYESFAMSGPVLRQSASTTIILSASTQVLLVCQALYFVLQAGIGTVRPPPGTLLGHWLFQQMSKQS
eukprot:6776749-Prorocentrum_lima.AAC.1